MIREEIAHLAVSIGKLSPHPRNPRRGDVETIAESIQAHGQYRPIVARKGSGEVLVGSHTLAAMRSLGAKKVAAVFAEVSDAEAAKIVAVDNRTSDLARYDDGLLAKLLGDLPDPGRNRVRSARARAVAYQARGRPIP